MTTSSAVGGRRPVGSTLGGFSLGSLPVQESVLGHRVPGCGCCVLHLCACASGLGCDGVARSEQVMLISGTGQFYFVNSVRKGRSTCSDLSLQRALPSLSVSVDDTARQG